MKTCVLEYHPQPDTDELSVEIMKKAIRMCPECTLKGRLQFSILMMILEHQSSLLLFLICFPLKFSIFVRPAGLGYYPSSNNNQSTRASINNVSSLKKDFNRPSASSSSINRHRNEEHLTEYRTTSVFGTKLGC